MPLVSVVMGSKSDDGCMAAAVQTLKDFGIDAEYRIVSAHRTPDLMYEFAKSASRRGVEVIIAGAGGAAHLPGMIASMTQLPVIGVPVPSRSLNGIDSLLSMVQMPTGVPVATVAIGNARNAALLALRILGIKHPAIADQMTSFMESQTQSVLSERLE